MRGKLILFALAGALFVGMSLRSLGASATISWNSSPSSSTTGYLVYYGTSSGNYITAVLVPSKTATNVTINGLTTGTKYYFAAAAYDASSDVSALSAEISGVIGSTTSSSSSGSAAAMTSPHASAGQFSFTVSGTSNSQYIVQASTNLVNWVSLQTNTSPFSFVDPNARQFSHRFYRTVSISN
jgi:Fibronectin type III domain